MELPNIQALKSFVIYGRLGNFTQAAREANVTQSAFSAQIKKLENVIGLPLIVRDTRGSMLTAEGKFFYKEAERILSELEQVVAAVRTAYESRRPELNIGIMRSMGDVLMNTHISYFKRHNPDFTVRVYDMEEEEIISDLYAGRIDAASVYAVAAEKWAAYETVPIGEDVFVYFAPRLTMSDTVKKEDILSQPLLRYPPKYFMDACMRDYLDERRSVEEIQLSNPYAMIDYCRHNKAGFLVSKRLAEFMGIRRKCRNMYSPLHVPVWMVFKKENPKGEYIRCFVNYLLKKSL